jgi:hypothetical protein
MDASGWSPDFDDQNEDFSVAFTRTRTTANWGVLQKILAFFEPLSSNTNVSTYVELAPLMTF